MDDLAKTKAILNPGGLAVPGVATQTDGGAGNPGDPDATSIAADPDRERVLAQDRDRRATVLPTHPPAATPFNVSGDVLKNVLHFTNTSDRATAMEHLLPKAKLPFNGSGGLLKKVPQSVNTSDGSAVTGRLLPKAQVVGGGGLSGPAPASIHPRARPRVGAQPRGTGVVVPVTTGHHTFATGGMLVSGTMALPAIQGIGPLSGAGPSHPCRAGQPCHCGGACREAALVEPTVGSPSPREAWLPRSRLLSGLQPRVRFVHGTRPTPATVKSDKVERILDAVAHQKGRICGTPLDPSQLDALPPAYVDDEWSYNLARVMLSASPRDALEPTLPLQWLMWQRRKELQARLARLLAEGTHWPEHRVRRPGDPVGPHGTPDVDRLRRQIQALDAALARVPDASKRFDRGVDRVQREFQPARSTTAWKAQQPRYFPTQPVRGPTWGHVKSLPRNPDGGCTDTGTGAPLMSGKKGQPCSGKVHWFHSKFSEKPVGAKGEQGNPYTSLQELEGHQLILKAGERVVFAAGDYFVDDMASPASKTPATFTFLLPPAMTNDDCGLEIVIEAELKVIDGKPARALVNFYSSYLPTYDQGRACFVFRPDGPGDSGTTSKVPLVIRDLHFHGYPTPSANRLIPSNKRAPRILQIDRIQDLTLERCSARGGENIGFDPAYSVKPLWANALIANCKKGKVVECFFECVDNIDHPKWPDWRWVAGSTNSHGLELTECANVDVTRCYFGSAGHISLYLHFCKNIKVEQCYLRNRIHTAYQSEKNTNDCIFARNIVAGCGARTDLVTTPVANSPTGSILVEVKGSRCIVAFNVLHGDAELKPNKAQEGQASKLKVYDLDQRISLAAGAPIACASDSSAWRTTRCMSTDCYTKWTKVEVGKALDKTCAADMRASLPKVCNDGSKMVPGCGEVGGMGGATRCCPAISAAAPTCSNGRATRCVIGLKNVCLWDKFVPAGIDIVMPPPPPKEGEPPNPKATPMPLYALDLGGDYDKEFFVAGNCIVNNLILDVGQFAIGLNQRIKEQPGDCKPYLRDTLIANNVIFGQRTDPTATFNVAFGGLLAPLPHKADHQRFGPNLAGLIQVEVPGTYDGTSNYRFVANVVGRRPTDPLAIEQALGLLWKGKGECGLGKCYGLDILKISATWYLDILTNPTDVYEETWSKKIIWLSGKNGAPTNLPAWVAKSKGKLSVSENHPFLTD